MAEGMIFLLLGVNLCLNLAVLGVLVLRRNGAGTQPTDYWLRMHKEVIVEPILRELSKAVEILRPGGPMVRVDRG